MKKQLIGLILLLPVFATMQAQKNFTIKGHLSGLKEPSKIMLQYSSNGEQMADSIVVQNGKFVLNGKIDEQVKATLTLKPLKNEDGPMTYEKMTAMDQQDFYLEKGSFTVKGAGNIKTAIVKGGKTQDDWLLLQAELQTFQDQMKPLQQKMLQYQKEKNETAIKELFPQLRAIRLEMNKVEDSFVYQHPDSYVSFDLVENKSGVIDPKIIEPLFSALSERLRNAKKGKDLGKRLAIAKRVEIGQPAINFTQNNTEGKSVSLSSLKGKYVLVDFWASWCGPCRAENPNVLKVYNKFRDQNFEIIAVSLDEKKEPWLQAIEKDALPWIHVSDLKGFENTVAEEYGVKAVPQNFLLNPEGIIIAKNLHGEELDKQLTELIKKL